jgi:glycerophosphoryl diester phosphodiesterase
VVVLVPILYYAVSAAMRTAPMSEVLVIAHRGGLRHAPENTQAAFRNGIAQGADGIEFDVQRTKDGALVVIHDETVDRTTEGSGAVGEMTLDEIRALDAGDGEVVPTFKEVIELGKAGGVMLLPEAKSPGLYPGMEAKMLEQLKAAEYLDRSIVQSFDADSLEALRAQDADVQLCALYGLWGFDVSAPAGDAQNVCPMAEMALLYPAMISQAHNEGRQVYVWFLALESRVTIDVLRFFGADGFMVDDPAAAIEALEK